MPVRVRPEEQQDEGAVRALNEAAFGASAEADIVDRLRAEAPPQPIGGSPLLRMLDVELRNDRDAATPLEDLGIRPRLLTPEGKPLPAGVVELPLVTPLERRPGEIEAGTSVRWYPRLMRIGKDVPKRFTCKASLFVRDPEQRSYEANVVVTAKPLTA